jgi:ketosteroid isomerase-like protein
VLSAALATAAAALAATALGLLGPGSPAAGAATGPLDDGEVRAAVSVFADAVAGENSAALSRVLTRDVQRVFPTDVQRGRAAVLATYRGQFRGNDIAAYEVGDVEVQGGPAGRATGTYRLERTGRPAVGGRIVFGVRRERGRPKIALIAATPD